MNEKTRSDIEKAAELLKQAGAKEVYLFGSAAEGRNTPDSDIDFAVRGLPSKNFFAAVGKLAMALSRPCDVVDLDEPRSFVRYLEAKAKLVRVA